MVRVITDISLRIPDTSPILGVQTRGQATAAVMSCIQRIKPQTFRAGISREGRTQHTYLQWGSVWTPYNSAAEGRVR
jgi:hypothetical protein